jgi:hypothetical protein
MLRQLTSADAHEAWFPCGHTITVPNAAINTAGIAAVPSECPYCYQQQLNMKWVHQQEAKLWQADPGWSGFPPVSLATAASAISSINVMKKVYPDTKTGPLAWLDYEVEKVCRLARGVATI